MFSESIYASVFKQDEVGKAGVGAALHLQTSLLPRESESPVGRWDPSTVERNCMHILICFILKYLLIVRGAQKKYF